MSADPRTVTATALLLAALAVTGCGLGAGDDVGEVDLVATGEFGTESVLSHRPEDATEADTVMRVLERNAEITTLYGGGFVQSIEGVEAKRGPGSPRDWFFFVNGVESSVGAADYTLHGGEAIWWDFRDWGATMRVPAVVGSWPQPFLGGYGGRSRSVAVQCRGGEAACDRVRRKLRGVGATLAADGDDAIRVLVGPWRRLAGDPTAAQIERGPRSSGVFATISRGRGCELRGLDRDGTHAARLGAGAGLIAATRRLDAPPVWVVTGCTGHAVSAATELLDATHLRDRYAVAADGGEAVPLPLTAGVEGR